MARVQAAAFPKSVRCPGLALALAAVAIVAGCTSPHPAPIVHRTPPGPPVAVARPAPPPLPPSPDAGPIVESVGSGRVETRPLPGTPQALPLPGTSGSTEIRSGPSALKRPYSDRNLAMAKSSALPPPAGAAAAPAPTAAATPASTAVSSTGFAWPSSGPVIENFSGNSTGVSIGGNAGDPVLAASDGRVIFAGKGPRGYGNLIIIKHEADILSVYGHNQQLLVKEGAQVKRGQRIAQMGNSDADRTKLHFEIRKDSRPVDPRQYLPSR
ncbi:MAG TPA: peptidoglycan DD-metalloendopeptidase family protein [Burkholderiaceae bacterium]|nr:peptidoglycan DD-metalloendopeptidase family protein [Burkholderiaceae bacterium]